MIERDTLKVIKCSLGLWRVKAGDLEMRRGCVTDQAGKDSIMWDLQGHIKKLLCHHESQQLIPTPVPQWGNYVLVELCMPSAPQKQLCF